MRAFPVGAEIIVIIDDWISAERVSVKISKSNLSWSVTLQGIVLTIRPDHPSAFKAQLTKIHEAILEEVPGTPLDYDDSQTSTVFTRYPDGSHSRRGDQTRFLL